MLIIREPQMEIFRRAAQGRFPEELVHYIAQSYPDATRALPSGALRKRVDYGIAQAHGRGFQDPNSIASFVALMFSMGPLFHRHAAFETILSDDRLTPGRRLSRLLEISAWSWLAAQDVSDAAWQHALVARDPNVARHT